MRWNQCWCGHISTSCQYPCNNCATIFTLSSALREYMRRLHYVCQYATLSGWMHGKTKGLAQPICFLIFFPSLIFSCSCSTSFFRFTYFSLISPFCPTMNLVRNHSFQLCHVQKFWNGEGKTLQITTNYTSFIKNEKGRKNY